MSTDHAATTAIGRRNSREVSTPVAHGSEVSTPDNNGDEVSTPDSNWTHRREPTADERHQMKLRLRALTSPPRLPRRGYINPHDGPPGHLYDETAAEWRKSHSDYDRSACRGPINVAYIRTGQPLRWVKVGAFCRKCGAFAPASKVPETDAAWSKRAIAEREASGGIPPATVPGSEDELRKQRLAEIEASAGLPPRPA